MSDSYKNYFIRNIKKIVAKLGNVALLDEISENDLSAELAEKINNSSSGDGIAKAYIVGSTPFTADWLSETAGGTALTPTAGDVYLILTSGAYQYSLVVYDGSAYAPITSEGLDVWEGTATQFENLESISYDTFYLIDGSNIKENTSIDNNKFSLSSATIEVSNGTYKLKLYAPLVGSASNAGSVTFTINSPLVSKIITETDSMAISSYQSTGIPRINGKSVSNGVVTILIDSSHGDPNKKTINVEITGNTSFAGDTITEIYLGALKLYPSSTEETVDLEQIGDLEDLTTTEKNTLVGAINEVNKITPLTQGEKVVLGEWINQTPQAIVNAIYAIASNMDESSLNSSYVLLSGAKYRFVSKNIENNVIIIQYEALSIVGGGIFGGVLECRSDNAGSWSYFVSSNGSIANAVVTNTGSFSAQLCKQVGMTAAEDGKVVLHEWTNITSQNLGNAIYNIVKDIDPDLLDDIHLMDNGLVFNYSGKYIYNGVTIYMFTTTFVLPPSAQVQSFNCRSDGNSVWIYGTIDLNGNSGYGSDTVFTHTATLYKRLSPSAKETVVARFTGNGSKTISQYFDEMFANVSAINLSGRAYLRQSSTQHPGYIYYKLTGTWDNEYMFERTTVSGGVIKERIINMRANSSFYKEWDGSNATDYSDNVMSTSETFELIL